MAWTQAGDSPSPGRDLRSRALTAHRRQGNFVPSDCHGVPMLLEFEYQLERGRDVVWKALKHSRGML